MNEIINKLLIAGDRSVSEMRLRQLAVPVSLGKGGFTFSAWGPFAKKKMQTFKETWDSIHIYQNKLHKANTNQLL